LALDLLAERALAVTDPLADLVERSPSLGSMHLDLRAPLLEELRAEALKRLAQLEQGQSLLLARGRNPFRVGCEPSLVGGDGFLLAPPELREMGLELSLPAVEIGSPGHEPAFEALLDGRDGLRKLDASPLGLALDDVAPLLGEAPLLLAELVTRVRTLTGEYSLQPEGVLAHLGLDELRELGARLVAQTLELADSAETADECDQPQFRDGCSGEAAAREEQRSALGVAAA